MESDFLHNYPKFEIEIAIKGTLFIYIDKQGILNLIHFTEGVDLSPHNLRMWLKQIQKICCMIELLFTYILWYFGFHNNIIIQFLEITPFLSERIWVL